MRLNLAFKIFIAFLATSFTIVVLMVVIMQFSAYRNFTSFIIKMETVRLSTLSSLLSDEYRQDQGWEKLKNSPKRWRELTLQRRQPPDFLPPLPMAPMIGLDDLPPLPPDELADGPDGRGPRPPGNDYDRGNDGKRHPPDENDWDHGRGDLEPKPPGTDPGRDRVHPPFDIDRRITLFDARQQPVIGSAMSTENHMLQEITVDGKTVGWVGIRKEDRLSDPLGIAFLKQQSRSFYTVGAVMLVLGAIVAFLLSRHLLSPIKELVRGTRSLTSRRFDTRITVTTSDELGQLADDFNQMAHTLEQYEHMRQQWISDIAHELRTPLSILRGEIEAMQDGIRETTSERLDSLHAEVVHMSKIVNDLHDLSVAESGALHFKREPVNLLKTVRSCLQKYMGRFEEHGIAIVDELGALETIEILGDRDRLIQVFTNLLENTLRYTDAPGALTASILSTHTETVLRFADTKPGVPPASLDRLFERLYRVDDSRNRATGGSGLGLAICKSIVEAHGGTISARNASSGGLQIEIILPLHTRG